MRRRSSKILIAVVLTATGFIAYELTIGFQASPRAHGNALTLKLRDEIRQHEQFKHVDVSPKSDGSAKVIVQGHVSNDGDMNEMKKLLDSFSITRIEMDVVLKPASASPR